MNKFIERPASKLALSRRKLVFGIGINDVEYITGCAVNGKRVMCPYYRAWTGMLKRCYSDKFQANNSTYHGCTVCKSWLVFSSFRAWMINQDWQNMELDKDIKVKGTKTYSPDTCLFISAPLNLLLNNNASRRGDYPRGVSLDKATGKFKAQIRCNNKKKHLGYHDTPKQAEKVYIAAFNAKLQQLIDNNTYPCATEYLHQHKELSS